jgi:hypothetical protein
MELRRVRENAVAKPNFLAIPNQPEFSENDFFWRYVRGLRQLIGVIDALCRHCAAREQRR